MEGELNNEYDKGELKLPNSLNTLAALVADQETTLQSTQMVEAFVSAVDTRSAAQIIRGLQGLREQGYLGQRIALVYQRIAVQLLETGRSLTLRKIKLALPQLLNGDSVTAHHPSSFFIHTTKKASSYASKPVISINIAARKRNTTTKAAPQMFFQFTTPTEETPF